jgi:hypothetical protein
VRLVPLIVLAVAVAAAGVLRLTLSAGERSIDAVMADSVQVLRVATDSCTADLQRAQTDLVSYRDRLDSLHAQVREYEAVEPRTVPAELFSEYMELFDRYNDSTAAWSGRVDDLQLKLEQCQALATAHNEAVDSLRVIRQ